MGALADADSVDLVRVYEALIPQTAVALCVVRRSTRDARGLVCADWHQQNQGHTVMKQHVDSCVVSGSEQVYYSARTNRWATLARVTCTQVDDEPTSFKRVEEAIQITVQADGASSTLLFMNQFLASLFLNGNEYLPI